MLIRSLRKLVCLSALLASAMAQAGPLILSGDTNLINRLGINAGNNAFFDNILGSGSSVGVLSTNPSLCCLGTADDNVVSYYDAKAGVTAALINGPIGAGSLAGFDVFVIAVPEAAIGAAGVTELSAFLAGSGTLFLLGDNASFPAENANLNSLLAALGSSMSIVADNLDAGFNPALIDAHPLTAGTAGFEYAATSRVAGGTSLYRSLNRSTFLAVENYGTRVPEPTSLMLAGIAVAALAASRRIRV